MNIDTLTKWITLVAATLTAIRGLISLWPKFRGLTAAMSASERAKERTLTVLSTISLISGALFYYNGKLPWAMTSILVFAIFSLWAFWRRPTPVERSEIVMEVALPIFVFCLMSIGIALGATADAFKEFSDSLKRPAPVTAPTK